MAESRITARSEDFAAWYQDVVLQGDMAEPAEVVKGCMVIKPNGLILWYDYRYKPRNIEVRAMRRDEVESLFPGCEVRLRSVTPIPPIRKLAQYSWLMAHTLVALTPLRTHYIGSLKKLGS